MDARKHLIIIKGKDQTDSVASFQFHDGKCEVVYTSAPNKTYNFQSSNVEILPLQKKIDPAQVIVTANGQTISEIDELLDFGGYYRIVRKGRRDLSFHLVTKNPTQGCALPKAEHKEMKTLTADQLSAFFREARDSGVYELYYLDLATGLRRGELLGLKWTDVDLDRGVLKIQRAISRQNGKVVEAPLKTKNAYRTLPLSADAISVLKMQKCKVGNSEWVFPSPTGGPMSPDSVLHMLQRVLKRAGLPRIRFHDLRHTFATMALQNGVDVKTVSSMLGHYSAGFTLDTYAHVTTDAQLKAAQTMGNILSRAV